MLEQLLQQLLSGDIKALARCISIVENEVGERGADGQLNDNRTKAAQVFIKRLSTQHYFLCPAPAFRFVSFQFST